MPRGTWRSPTQPTDEAQRRARGGSSPTLLLESSARAGGRIHTLHDAGAGMPIELGAEFVHGEASEGESAGTVEAALASGKRAARQVLRRLAS